MTGDKELEAKEEIEVIKTELVAVKHENEVLNRELESQKVVTTRVERTLNDKDREITDLKQEKTEIEGKLHELDTALAEAVAGYKALLVESNSGVLAELIAGDNINEVNDSLKNARVLVDRVRQEVEAEVSRTRVPAGAPQRIPLEMSGLTPREKIQYAIKSSLS